MQEGKGHLIGKPLELALSFTAKLKTPSEIHVLGICKELGITVVFRDFSEIDGLLVRSGGGTFIAVNENKPFARKRFTIAHEIGHFLMHDGEEFDENGNSNPTVEREADVFATNLLIPEAMVRSIYSQFTSLSIGMDTISEMAWIFRVSKEAMRLRLLELNLDTEK